MGKTIIKVLDVGYIQEIERWGTDASIIEAARMSTDKGFLGWGSSGKCTACNTVADPYVDVWCKNCGAANVGKVPGDEKLLKYLYDNKHNTPFEFCGMTIEVQAPIFVFREWHR